MAALQAPPSLLTLYAKAAVTGPLHQFFGSGGSALPDSTYTLADQPIDRAHLRAYQDVCGFRVRDELPPTYLHVLAFPLSVALMTEASFPFPLVGLVHVNNAITVHRPVTADETFSLTVRAENLRPHPAGRVLDVLGEAVVDGQTVWSGRSTYLRRGVREAPKPKRTELDSQPGPVALVRVPGGQGRRYAAVSGDRNPIHLHALSARLFGFPAAIAHGMWLKARTLASLEGRLPDGFTVDVAFKLPVPLPSTVAIGAVPAEDGWDLDVRAARSGKPHLAGTVRSG